MATPTTFTIELDLDGHLARHVGYDEDGEPVSQHTTIEDLVIGLAANKLVDRVMGAREDWIVDLRRMIVDVRREVVAERLRPIVDEAMDGSFRRTNDYGEPYGEPTTMRDLIAAQFKEWLSRVDGDRYRNEKRLPNFARIVAEQVDKSLKKELLATLEEAKEQARAAVKAKAADVIADSIVAMAKEGGLTR